MNAINKAKLKRLISIITLIFLFTLSIFLVSGRPLDLLVVLAVSFVISSIVATFAIFLPKENYWNTLGILTGFGITIMSWFVGNYFNNITELKRDQINREHEISNAKRELRVKYLINAFNRITSQINRDSETMMNRYIYNQNALFANAEVSLFGDTDLIRIMRDFTLTMNIPGKSNATPIILALRKTLRKELELSELPDFNTTYGVAIPRVYIEDWYRKKYNTSEEERQNIINYLNTINSFH